MNAPTRKITAPQPHPETEAFWSAAKEGRLLIKRCEDCGKPHYFPRAVCPYCLSDKTAWMETTGRGTLYSFSTLHVAQPPYTIAYVALEEGVTMLTNMVDCDPNALKVGMPVKVAFRPAEDGTMAPMFTPA